MPQIDRQPCNPFLDMWETKKQKTKQEAFITAFKCADINN